MREQIKHHQESQQGYYDKEYAFYNEMETLRNWRLSFARKVLGTLRPSYNDIFVDIGVGGSGYTVVMAAKKGIPSIGIDISVAGMRRAKIIASKLLAGQPEFCEFIACSATHLPLRDASVTKIASIAVLEHVADDVRAIEEFSRVSNHFGEVLVNVPNSYRRIPFIFILPYLLHDRKVGHLRHYKAENLALLFAKRGLSVKDVFYSGHFPKILQFIINGFLDCTERAGSYIWWHLERLDSAFRHIPTGMQLFMLFKRDGHR